MPTVAAKSRQSDSPIDPADPAKPEMWGYLDPLHYKKEVGDLVLEKLFSEEGEALSPEDFGVRISPDQIHDHLMQIRAGRDNYQLPKL